MKSKYMHFKRWLIIDSNERFILLKLMNGLYGISLVENAINTQEFLAKIILFLKYSTSEDIKLIRLKQELDIIQLFAELLSASSGNKCSVSLDISDRELLNLYIPSKSLLTLLMELSASTKDAANEASCVVHVNQKDEYAMISIENVYSSGQNKMQAMVDRLRKSFEVLPESSVSLVLDSAKSEVSKIIIKAAI